MNPTRQSRATLLASLPPEWPTTLLPQIRAQIQAVGRTLVVLDDDPTGTQTVYDVPVLTTWTLDALQAELAHAPPVFYILTNSRSLPLAQAQAMNREIGTNLRQAAQQTGRAVAVVSRSDSTLRGHYPGEVDALAASLRGPDEPEFDGDLIIPFFLEGGRLTIDDVHYVAEGYDLIPAAETPFARDAAFGYTHSHLPAWVEEKTEGRVPATQVAAISLQTLRTQGPDAVTAQLLTLRARQPCVVNAVTLRDMEVFVAGLLGAEAQGKRFLYRTAASFVQIRAGLETQPLLDAAALEIAPGSGGLFVVGSHVPKTTGQVNALLAQKQVHALEVDVARLLDDATQAAEIARVIAAADTHLAQGAVVVIYTSRTLITGDDADSSLAIGQRVSAGLVAMVRGLHTRPGYLVAKGGITSSDIATQALNVQRAMVAGQILPGVPVWRTGAESRFPGLPYIVFPGNVGDDQALVTIMHNLS
ncbi:MAG: four-carbon acid sugar kinase family protein [Litorilinea sp.]